MKIENLKLKIIFLGTPRFGAIILEKLAKSEYKPVLVITEPDKPAGRKQKLTPPPVKITAEKYNIPVEQPKKITNYKLQITNYKPELIIVAAYGQILPKEILEIPKSGCLNVHPSLLPKYRGPSPIQTAILNRDKETGVTIILMDKKIDHGPILAKQELEITNSKLQITNKFKIQNSNYKTLETKLAEIGADLLIETIPKWVNKKNKAIPQNENEATYTKIIKKDNGKIDWKKSAKDIEAQIRAFHIWPTAYTFWQNKRIKILEAEAKELPNEKKYDIGGVVTLEFGEIAVACKSDFLVIKKVQMEGKKPMAIREFIKGHPKFVGTILE